MPTCLVRVRLNSCGSKSLLIANRSTGIKGKALCPLLLRYLRSSKRKQNASGLPLPSADAAQFPRMGVKPMQINVCRLFNVRMRARVIFAAFALVPLAALPACASTGGSAVHLRLVSANAQLTTPLNAARLKQGEPVTAKLTGNVKAIESSKSFDLPRGTVLIGKVEDVTMPGHGVPAKISLLFNRARLRNGHIVPIKATILGAYPQDSLDSFNYTGVGGPAIGLQSRYIPYDQRVDQEPGTLSHVAMHSAVQSPVSGVFTSKSHNIKLHRGLQLQFAIAPLASAAKS